MRGNLVDFTEIAVHAPSKIDLFASLQRQTGRFDAANRGLRTCKTYSNLLKSVSYPELRLYRLRKVRNIGTFLGNYFSKDRSIVLLWPNFPLKAIHL